MSYHQVNIRTKDTQRSVLVVDAGYFLTREVMRAIEVEGHRLITVPMQADSANLTPDLDKYSTFLNNVVSIAERENPDYLLTVNHLGFDAEGRFTELLEALNLPGLIWYVDSPRYILLNHLANASENVGIFLWDDGYSSWIREAGFEKVHSLPLATDPEIFDVSRGRPLSINNDKLGPLIFVGDSMNEAVDKAFGKLPPELRLNGGNGMGEVIDNFTSRFCDTVLTSSPRNGQPVWDTFSDLLATDEMIAQIAGISTEVELKFESALVITATRNQRNRFMKDVSYCVLHGDLAS